MSDYSETYEFLKTISEGDTSNISFNRWSYPNLIYDIKYNSQHPGSTIVYIVFENDEEYLKVLNIDNDDDIYVWNKFMGNYYYGYDYEYERYNEDWREGWLIPQFSPENIELVKKILALSNPTLNFDINDTDSEYKVSNYLYKRFDDIEYIINDYTELSEECKARAVKNVLESETKSPFRKFGITQEYGRRFKTTVNVLLHWYDNLDVKEADLEELLQTLVLRYDKTDRGDWYELEYNVWCDDFDRDTFDRNTKSTLEKIIERIKEEISENVDLEEINDLYNKVDELGGFNRWINLKEKKAEVYFRDLDTKKGILTFYYRSPKTGKATEERSVKDMEELNLSLYHPELFEEIKKIKGIIL
jgi:hypothetical protein